MTRRLQIRPEAEADLAEAFQWYERERPGLGAEFIEAIEAVVQSIESSPLRFPVLHLAARRALAQRFPYAVFFVAEGEVVTVLAIIHQARDPERWKGRL